MLPIRYTYLFSASLYLIPWILIYITRKDLRKLLLPVGLFFMVLGLIDGYFWWTSDWWKPQTITNTVVGIEDVISGFTKGGLAACLYLVIFRKKLVENIKINTKKKIFILGLITVFSLSLFAFLFSLKVSSFVCNLVVMLSASGMLMARKREFIIPAVINGVLMLMIVVPMYLITMYATTGFLEKTWLIKNLSGIYFLRVPIEDFVFYFLIGVLGFGIYPFYTDSKLANFKSSSTIN